MHLEEANEHSLTESEEEFASTRRAASQRLLILLGAGLLIGIAVRYSLAGMPVRVTASSPAAVRLALRPPTNC